MSEKRDALEAAELLGGEHQPCPMCPLEIRSLSAVAHNVVEAWKRGDMIRVQQKLHDLERAVQLVEPLSAHHFAGVRRG